MPIGARVYDYKLNHDNNFVNNMIFNANHFDSGVVSNANGHGYAFLNWYTCDKSTTVINLNNDTADHAGFHLKTYYKVD